MTAGFSLSAALRFDNHEGWVRATSHRFVQELGSGTLDDRVLRGYLVQDYAFVGTLTSLVGLAIARAPTMAGKRLFAGFAAVLTSDENTYFERCFDSLGVPPADRTAPVLWSESQQFLDLLIAAGEGGYADILSVLLPAEWIYLDWASAEAAKAPVRFEHAEWIHLHAVPAFADFVNAVAREFDAATTLLDDAGRQRVADRFRAMVELEGAFFDATYR
ncbi:thiaminase/transcriptional activator TenA [Stella humosa]|uniref:Aminopyrimidine aminohydrolase n=1 Tax=Stella humosa TaxID=94 RepID=A0A3N1LDT4_9PROT|nr:TenA family protein [Stella humosa]ROP91261.1 thiaminase/transcriptional activator TenA [Stella humosa]BBK34385.1 aminopyrimidine aminohydrolase [Stella humosa]